MDGEGGCLATCWVSPQKLYSPKAISNQMNLTETKKTYLIFSGTVPFRNHHGCRRWSFGDMLSIPTLLPPLSPPLCQAGGGRQQEPSGQDQYNHKAGPSPASCHLATIQYFFCILHGKFFTELALLCTRNSPAKFLQYKILL